MVERRVAGVKGEPARKRDDEAGALDAKGVIQIFNVGAERMLGYMAAGAVAHGATSCVNVAFEHAGNHPVERKP